MPGLPSQAATHGIRSLGLALPQNPALIEHAAKRRAPMGELFRAAFLAENTMPVFWNQLTAERIHADSDYAVTEEQLASDIARLSVPQDHLAHVMKIGAEAVSQSDYERQLEHYIEYREAEQMLGNISLPAQLGIRITAALIDPAILLGSAAAYKAARIGQIAHRGWQIAATGALGSGESLLQEAIVGAENADRDEADLVIAGAAGFVFGAGAGALGQLGTRASKALSAPGSLEVSAKALPAPGDGLDSFASDAIKQFDEELKKDIVPADGPNHMSLNADGEPVLVTGTVDPQPPSPLALRPEAPSQELVPPGSPGSPGSGPPDAPGSQIPADDSILGKVEPAPMVRYKGARMDSFRMIGGSASGAVRGMAAKLLPEHVGWKDKAYSQGTTATELQQQIQSRFTVPIAKEFTEGWVRYAKKHRLLPALAAKHRENFDTRVTDSIRGMAETDPDILRVRDATRQQLHAMLEDGKRTGVFDADIPSNPNYVPRLYDQAKVVSMIEEFGSDAVEKVVRHALDQGNPELARATARVKKPDGTFHEVSLLDKVARGVARNIAESSMGLDSGLAHGLKVDDVNLMRQLLRESGVEERHIDILVKGLQRKVANASRISHAKRRIDVDETAWLRLRSKKTGELVKVDVGRMTENNIQALLQRYGRRVSGASALKELIGITGSKADVQRLHNEVMRRSIAAGETPRQAKNAADAAAHIVRNVAGMPNPHLDPNSRLSKTSEVIRATNFLLYMGQAAWASVSEVGHLVAKGGFGVLWAIPAFRKFIRKSKDGTIGDETVEFFEEYIGIGAEDLISPASVLSRWDTVGDEVSPAGGLVTRLRKLQRFSAQYVSGLGPMTRIQRRLASLVALRQIEKMAHKGGRLRKSEIERLAMSGIRKEELPRILAAMQKHGISMQSGYRKRSFRRTDLEAMRLEFPDEHAKLMLAIQRDSYRTIIESSSGAMPLWTYDNPVLGSLLLQFQSFMINAHSKHLLAGLARRDAEAMTTFLMGAAFAGMAWALQQHANGRGDKITMERMVKSAAARAAHSAFIPMIVDTGANLLLGDPLFDSRTTGLPSGKVTSIPAMRTLDNVATAAKGAFQAVRGDGYTQETFKAQVRIVPFLNQLYGVNASLAELAKRLPKQRELE